MDVENILWFSGILWQYGYWNAQFERLRSLDIKKNPWGIMHVQIDTQVKTGLLFDVLLPPILLMTSLM